MAVALKKVKNQVEFLVQRSVNLLLDFVLQQPRFWIVVPLKLVKGNLRKDKVAQL